MIDYCDSGSLYSFDSEECEPCPFGCDNCLSTTMCIDCSEGFLWTSYGDCVQECPEYYFWNRTSHSCEHYFCWEGDTYNAELGTCFECGEDCLSCAMSGCQECKGGMEPNDEGDCERLCNGEFPIWNSETQSCEGCSEFEWLNSFNNTCFGCPEGEFVSDPNTCQMCSDGCLHCFNDSDCQVCDESFDTITEITELEEGVT